MKWEEVKVRFHSELNFSFRSLHHFDSRFVLKRQQPVVLVLRRLLWAGLQFKKRDALWVVVCLFSASLAC
jgi:hypothetical protein